MSLYFHIDENSYKRMSSFRFRYQQFMRNAFGVSVDLLAALSRKLSSRPIRRHVHQQCESELNRARKKSWITYYKVMARQLHEDLD